MLRHAINGSCAHPHLSGVGRRLDQPLLARNTLEAVCAGVTIRCTRPMVGSATC